jgi:anti-anti-sigma factor
MALDIVPSDTPGRLRLVGELDLANAESLLTALQEAAHTGDVLLDVSELQFVDSSGIRALLQAHIALKEQGRGLVLLSPTPFVRRIFDTLELAANGVDIRGEEGSAT